MLQPQNVQLFKQSGVDLLMCFNWLSDTLYLIFCCSDDICTCILYHVCYMFCFCSLWGLYPLYKSIGYEEPTPIQHNVHRNSLIAMSTLAHVHFFHAILPWFYLLTKRVDNHDLRLLWGSQYLTYIWTVCIYIRVHHLIFDQISPKMV